MSLSADGKGRKGDRRRLGDTQHPCGRLWFWLDSSFHWAKLFAGASAAGASADPAASAVDGADATGVAGAASVVDGAATMTSLRDLAVA